MSSTIGNFKQCKQIIDTGRKHIYKRDSLDGCAVTKHSDAKDTSFQKEDIHLLFPVGNIKGIKVLPRNIIPIWSRIMWSQFFCLLDDLHQLRILSQQKRKNMAMDEVRSCNIHTSWSIGVNQVATKLHLGDGSALDFLPPPRVKEQAWNTGSWSAATETGTRGHSPRALQGRKSRQTILCLTTNLRIS